MDWPKLSTLIFTLLILFSKKDGLEINEKKFEGLMIQWNNTRDTVPEISENPFDSGWVLGRFSRTKFSTVRYIFCEGKWQMWDYSWCERPPMQWTKIPKELYEEKVMHDHI